MTRFNAIGRLAICSNVLLLLVCRAVVSTAEPAIVTLQELDAQREELKQKLEQCRANPNRMYRRTGLAETHMKLLFLDYDDPRTKLGAAVAMNNISHEQLVEIVFAMTFARPPTDDEQRRCLEYLKEHAGELKLAVKDIIWACCNSREFVDRIDN